MNVPYKTVTLQKGLLSTHTVLILLRNLEKQAKQVFLFENDSSRMLSWMFYVVASFSIAVITTTSCTDPAREASKLIMKKIF